MHISIIIIMMYTYINTYLRNNGAIRAVNNNTVLYNNNNRIATLSERTEKSKAELRPGSRPQILALKRRPDRQPENCKLSELICKCAL